MPTPIRTTPSTTPTPSSSGVPLLKDPAAVAARVASMTTQQKAKLLVMNYGDVNSAPWSGSVIVNQTHLTATGVPALKRTTGQAAQRSGATVLVAADQEGGMVNRMKRVPGYETVKFPSPAQMQAMTPAQLRAEGERVGKALQAAGVNTLLGPVLDAASPGTLMEKQGRSFGTTPAQVMARAQPFIDGVRAANPNVVLIAKHFPGYDVKGNSDIVKVNDPSTLEQVKAKAAPFTSLNGLSGVMVNSVSYPNIDGKPACFSEKIIGLLREKNPNALVVTDDVAAGGLLTDKAAAFKMYQVEARATDAASVADVKRLVTKYPDFATPAGKAAMSAQVHAEIRENAKKAFLAGCDVVLTMDSREAPAIAEAITELITQHPELKPRLDAAATRMLQASIAATPGHAAPQTPQADPNRPWSPR